MEGIVRRRFAWQPAPLLAILLSWGCAPRQDNASAGPFPAGGPLPAIEAHLGFALGEDRRLADWTQITGYMAALAQASPRVRLDTLGPTTLDRPFIMLTIAEPATLARLERFREIQQTLADPRRIASDAAAEALIAEGKTVVLVTSSIHSTEVGATQVPLALARRLALGAGAVEREILANTIVLLVPSLNPDGVDLVVDWYRGTVGQPWEGTGPPFLYHHYTGHDNNRDWYAFTQRETRLAIAHGHNAWRPQIVHDIHQMGARGARLFLPPYIDPIEPNVDPLLVQGVNELGTFMAWELGRQGKTGVVVNGIFDAFTPARAYQHYHAGVRILSETASANMASPIHVAFDSLQPGRGYDARTPSWNFPEPWPGGDWRLADIIDYQESAAVALLAHAARHRERWLRSFLEVGRRAVAGWERWPEAWVLPAAQRDPVALDELLRILTTADVEVRRAGVAFQADGRSFPAGSFVIPMRQPYAAFAQAVLERQVYPDLRVYPGGPPQRPYDVTAQTLPLLLGVEATAAARLEPGLAALALSAPVATPAVVTVAAGLSREAGRPYAGPRIAIYQSHVPAMDEGWTRWVLDRYAVPFHTLKDDEVRRGGLRDRYDVVLLASQSPRDIRQGRRAETVPPELAGGLGDEGVRALADFVRAGGRLIALEEASAFAIEALALPLREVTTGLAPGEFYIPGSILRLDLEAAHPLAAGMPATSIAWYGNASRAFEATGPAARIVGRYGAGDPLLSGWILGAGHVAGKGALAEVRVGQGSVVLFGFRPQYRGQTMATFPLLFNALRAPAAGRAGTGGGAR
jgi:hypothetical protein